MLCITDNISRCCNARVSGTSARHKPAQPVRLWSTKDATLQIADPALHELSSALSTTTCSPYHPNISAAAHLLGRKGLQR